VVPWRDTAAAAPDSTGSEFNEKLNTEINAVFAVPKMKARFAELGSVALPGSLADFGKLVEAETEKWAKVVKFSAAKPH
jgi:tripartite-type tricarboxylate transporter receptor subunit TctC